MAEYRAYAIEGDGHIAKSASLICDDDSGAMERAKKAFENYVIEVCSGERFMIRLEFQG
jgi:hypothetical protein